MVTRSSITHTHTSARARANVLPACCFSECAPCVLLAPLIAPMCRRALDECVCVSVCVCVCDVCDHFESARSAYKCVSHHIGASDRMICPCSMGVMGASTMLPQSKKGRQRWPYISHHLRGQPIWHSSHERAHTNPTHTCAHPKFDLHSGRAYFN